ncbi:MAG TPA: hypothetical protein DDZ89_16340, partial [Clostridiales bacterium]|nr:hypothetical protein [Clostridiales bacterium]
YKDEDGVIFFFTPALWAYQKKYINSELPDIAKTDPVGTAHILALICENYDNYVPALDHYYTFYPVSKMAGSPYPYYGGLWTNWFYSDLNFVANIAEAYALVNKTNALDKIGAETRRDLHTQILSMIKDTVDFSDSYGIQDSNMDPTQWRGLIRIGKALQQPDYIHYALERIDSFVKNNYLFDGFWKEVTMSYHNQTTSGLISVFSLLSKYSDPEGYVYPGTGERVDHFRFLDRYPFLETSHSLSGLLAYPNGKHLPIQDTHASGQGTRTKEAFENIIMSASGIARLTGNPDVVKVTGTQAVLTYVPKYGHIHRDTLNMNLFGYGVELLPDLGYTHTRNRSWTASTLAHNTVVVNQRNSNGTHVGNTLRYVPSENSVGIMRAFDPNAYSEANVYDREVIYVPGENDTPEGYILDLFRVLGGDRHEYTLNMCADYDYELTTDITWQKKSETMLPEGVPCVKPTAQNDSGSASGHYTAYMFVEDVQWAELKDQPFQIHYTVSEAGTYTNVGLNILGASTTGHMSLGSAPSMRATRMSTLNDSNDQCDDYLMDKMVLRREGSNLSSCFVTVMEPYSAKYQGKIKSVQRLQVEGLHEFDVVVKVVADEFTDYIFSAFREDMDVTVDQIEFKGQFGYIRLQNKKAVLMQTLNADVLSYDNTTISENRSLPGVVTDVLNKSEGDAWNGFVTNVKPDEELIGQYIIVKHPDQTYTGYQITGIIEKDGSFVIDIGNAEPGFAFIGDQHTKMIFYPHTERKGVIEFTIDHSKKYTIKN